MSSVFNPRKHYEALHGLQWLVIKLWTCFWCWPSNPAVRLAYHWNQLNKFAYCSRAWYWICTINFFHSTRKDLNCLHHLSIEKLYLSFGNIFLFPQIDTAHKALTHLPLNKMAAFRRRYFQVHLCEWKVLYIWIKFYWSFVLKGSIYNNPAML